MDQKRRLPGGVWRIVSLVPGFNWIALLYIGIINSKLLSIIWALIYGIITYKSTSLSPLIWIAVIIHYSVVYTAVKRKINADMNKGYTGTDGERKYDGFTDIDLKGEPEARQSIPQRAFHTHNQNKFSVSVVDSKAKFLGDMEKYSAKEEKQVAFVPFMAYWPTYDSMDKTQKAWYFYWRSQIRQGKSIDTDLSYIFVYVYELISGIGWTRPEDGYAKLRAVWTEYRGRFPKLDWYLPDWIFDFAQIHKLDYDLPIEKGEMNLVPSVITDVLVDRHAEDIPLKLPFSLISALTDYTMRNSKFYKDGNQTLIREAIPRVVALVDAIL